MSAREDVFIQPYMYPGSDPEPEETVDHQVEVGKSRPLCLFRCKSFDVIFQETS